MNKPKRCFICKQFFPEPHFFYPGLCLPCGELNYDKRSQTADLGNAIAIVTGARVKIGYAVALRLLRDGARVIATTRFPRDAASRYAKESDFQQWRDRLQIYQLDLRHLATVESFAQHVTNCYPRLDIVINNAAQTIRRPSEFYQHLQAFESLPPEQLPPEIRQLVEPKHSHNIAPAKDLPMLANSIFPRDAETDAPLLSPDEGNPLKHQFFPPGMYDEDNQQLDLRPFNSWLMKDEEVSILELLEVHVINAIAPFVINSRLKPLMKKSSDAKYIINVSSMEGQFNSAEKPWRHPHTNMAKASLNQMTRTCASEYAKHRIFMNAVDPGWISFQHPQERVEAMRERGIKPPFDLVDAAARICDLVYLGRNREYYPYGKFFKHYVESSW